MSALFNEALAKVLAHEGGFVDHPQDPGGMTNLGVTRQVWSEWIGHPATKRMMRSLTPSDVAPLYWEKYWRRVRGDELPRGVGYCVFDAAVNSGPGRAAKWLQEVVGAQQDGDIGPRTLAAVQAMPSADIIERLSAVRLEFLINLQTWMVFGRGWERRVRDVRRDALDLAAAG